MSIHAVPVANVADAFVCVLSSEALVEVAALSFVEGLIPILPFRVLIQEAPFKVTTSPLT
jgi:hypothetical protein